MCSNWPRRGDFWRRRRPDMAAQFGVPLLASLPLDRRIREQTDNGGPTVVDVNGDLAEIALQIPRHRQTDYSRAFPDRR